MLNVLSVERRRVICAFLALSLRVAAPAYAQSAENVAVVINDNSPQSQRIGEHYARTRSLPPENVLRVRVSTQETIERGVYASLIEAPIAAALRRAGLQDRILYLVLTKGVPLRIAGTTGLNGTLSSVDAELTLLYRRMTGEAVPVAGKIDNPYFLGSRDLREALPFSHREHDIYLVTRLDAFTVDQALALIDKAQTTTAAGQIVLDQREDDPTKAGNQWMAQAARRLAEQGQGSRVVLETTAAPAKVVGPTLGFYSWSAADPEYRRRITGLTFATGAIAANLAGSDARTFQPPPDNWAPTGDPATLFAGTPDALIGDLIREGVTGVAGQVGEPLLLGAVRPDVLFPAYLAGYNLAEAFYLAMPTLSWTTIVVGDPLCRPFTGRVLTRSDLDSAIDKETDLPTLFSARRLARAVAGAAGVPQSAAVLAVRAETLLAKADRAGARAALEQAVAVAPSAIGLLMNLALLEEADGSYDAAIAHYRRILELQPSNVIALNNVAYALAVYRKAPAEGLPLAKRAAALAPRSGSVIDTLAWIEHLLGNDAAAAPLLASAIRLDPESSDIRLHAATVAAASGDRAHAERELKEAIRLDPSIDQRAETKELRERIAALPVQKP